MPLFPPPRSLPLDQEALRIYERAYYIGAQTENTGDPPISFTPVMAALLFGEDDTSGWFVLDAFGDAVKNTDELQARLAHIRNRPGRMLSDLGWGRSVLFAGLVLLLPPLIGWGRQQSLALEPDGRTR